MLCVTTTRRRPLPKPFVAACAALGACFVAYWGLWFAALTVERDDEVVRSYAGVETLRVDGGNGDIDVIAEDRDDVRLTAHRSWSFAKPELDPDVDDGILRLKGDCGFWGSFGPNGCNVRFELRVPRDVEIDVRGSAGDVTGRGLAARSYLGTSSGDVTAVDVTGPLGVGTSSGDVTVEGYRGSDVTAQVSSGDIAVRAQTPPDRVEAVASSGDVTVAVPGGVRYRVDTDTASGDESVQVDQDPDAPREIRASASSGDVSVVRLGDAR